MTKGTTDIGLYGLSSACLDNEIPVKSYDYYAKIANKADRHFGALSSGEKHELFYAFTKSGFKESMMTGRMPDGSEMTHLGDGRYVDKIGLIRDKHGPFWPPDYGPLHPSPVHRRTAQPDPEPLSDMCEGKSLRDLYLANTRHSPKVESMLARRRRRLSYIDPTLGERLVFVV